MKRDMGFTLIELMIAAAILLIVLSGLLVTFVYCILLNQTNKNLVTAVNDAQFVLEQIRGLDYGAIDNYTSPTFVHLQNESIPQPTITSLYNNHVKEISVNVNWVERGRQRNFQLSTRVAR